MGCGKLPTPTSNDKFKYWLNKEGFEEVLLMEKETLDTLKGMFGMGVTAGLAVGILYAFYALI